MTGEGGAGAPNCGCRVVPGAVVAPAEAWQGDPKLMPVRMALSIVYCPTHAAAFRLAAALKILVEYAEVAPVTHGLTDQASLARALLREIGR